MNNFPSNVKKYLEKFGFKEWQLFKNYPSSFNNIIIIPAISELENIQPLLSSIAVNDKKYLDETLIIFVINNTAAHSRNIKENNFAAIELLKKEIYKNQKPSHKKFNRLNIDFIDASTPGNELPEKDGGVGFARKIGMDLALTKFDYKSSNKKLILSLDADCRVADNYLGKIITSFNQKKYSAAVVGYEHEFKGDDENIKAIICYEIFLRYYVLGLKFADSPYAFHTVGSTIVCDYESYIKTGGMNKKKAAEDFYFLEKLAKISGINYIKSTTIYPSNRSSWRVPFGTGQRITRFLSKTHPEYILYNPESFEILRSWNRIFLNEQIKSAEEYLNDAKNTNEGLFNFLFSQNFREDWNKIIKNTKKKNHIILQKKLWFDGFRTLKLIHFLRDNSLPDLNMFTALNMLFRMNNFEFSIPGIEKSETCIPPVEIQKKYLTLLRNLT